MCHEIQVIVHITISYVEAQVIYLSIYTDFGIPFAYTIAMSYNINLCQRSSYYNYVSERLTYIRVHSKKDQMILMKIIPGV